ncbi:hypothetical protein N9113_02600 [Akkermansiaceae bacterium]|nr:hypothetical protein [Akkermansiaceae bacterium]
MHEDDLKVIGKSLDALVKLRELKSKRIQLKPAKEIGEEKLQKLFSNVEAVGLTYGIFMAREMCDLGARLSFFTIAEDQQLKLHLRLPEKEMKEFEAALFKLGVVAEIKKPVEEPKK